MGAGSTRPWRTPWRRASSWPKSWGRTEVCGIYGIAGFGGSGGGRLVVRGLPPPPGGVGGGVGPPRAGGGGGRVKQSPQVFPGDGVGKLRIIDIAGGPATALI